MIRTVFFDLGKILVDFDLEICLRKLAQTSGRSIDEIKGLMFSPRMHDFERGLLSGEEFLGEIHSALDYPVSLDQMVQDFNDIFTLMPHNVSILENLSKKLPVGLISNTNHLHAAFVESNFDFPAFFTRRIYSQDTGFRKPEAAIFEMACEALRTTPEESLFIDDLITNIEGARAIGFHTIHLAPGQDLAMEMRRFPELQLLI